MASSLERLIRVTDQGKVIYLAEKRSCRRFPKPASPDLFSGVARNFQIFDALDAGRAVAIGLPRPSMGGIPFDTRPRRGRLLAWRCEACPSALYMPALCL